MVKKEKLLALVVDGGEDDRKQVRVVLEALGFEVREADNGLDALVRLTGPSLDLLICDTRLTGEIQGPELIRTAKDKRYCSHGNIKTFLLSDDEDLEPMANSCGADGFAPKSVSFHLFRKTIESLMDSEQRRVA